jgi:hypothetical protein
LGTGGQYQNLISLATFYPDAKVYGIDTDTVGLTLVEQIIPFLAPNLAPRIELINASYTQYTGPLQKAADIVVVVAPQRYDRVLEGVMRFIKPGGQVEILTEDPKTRDELVKEFSAKNPIVTQLLAFQDPSKSFYVASGTAIGAPLASIQFGGRGKTGDAWEIYIPSW